MYTVFGNFALATGLDKSVDPPKTITKEYFPGEEITPEIIKQCGANEQDMLEAKLIDLPYTCLETVWVNAAGDVCKSDDPNCTGWLYTANQIIPMAEAKKLKLPMPKEKKEEAKAKK